MEYRINSQAMELIAKLYDGDITKMKLEEDQELSIPVTSGIRQGCTVSTALFKLVTYKIMKKLEELNKGFEDDIFQITSLFFPDDGMLLTDSIKNTEMVVDTVTKVSRECGLNIIKEKSNIIIFNMRDKPMNIAGIKVENKIKYLGITINDSNDTTIYST